MGSKLFPFWWLVAPELVEIFTVYTYEIDGTYDDGASLISGPIVIDGLFIMAKISVLEGDDYGGLMGIDLNGVDVSSQYPYVEGSIEGLMGSEGVAEGIMTKHKSENIDIPHTSFDVKNRDGASRYFHRTVKVLILNRIGS